MICPKCGAIYPAPKRRGGRSALVLAIVLVVGAATGLLAACSTGASGGPKVTGTAPASAEDWARGATRQWQQTFTGGSGNWGAYSAVVTSAGAWLAINRSSAAGIDPASGQILWQADTMAQYLDGCANALVDGKWACVGQFGSSGQAQMCLIDPMTGDKSCAEMQGAATLPPGGVDGWNQVSQADGALIVTGDVYVGDTESYYWEVARLSVPSLKIDWAKTYDVDCGGGVYEPAPKQSDKSGVTGNVLWFSGAMDQGPAALAVDIRNGEPLFPQNECTGIYPLSDGTFAAGPGTPVGPLTLPGGGQITVVNSGGAIEYGSGQFPQVPVYYVPGPSTADQWSYTDGTLGSGSALWPVTVQLQQFIVGGQFLAGAASGNTLVVGANAGQVVAVDCTTGQILWSVTVPLQDEYANLDLAVVGNVVVVTILGYAHGNQTVLLSLATGQQVAQMPGVAVASADGSMLAIVDSTDASMTVSRYVPSGG